MEIFKQILKSNDFAEEFSEMCQATIAYHERRMHATALEEDLHIYGNIKHFMFHLNFVNFH